MKISTFSTFKKEYILFTEILYLEKQDFEIFLYCMIFNNQLRSFVYLALYAIQDRMRLMQRKTKFGPNRQTQKEICFHEMGQLALLHRGG